VYGPVTRLRCNVLGRLKPIDRRRKALSLGDCFIVFTSKLFNLGFAQGVDPFPAERFQRTVRIGDEILDNIMSDMPDERLQ
jgi:hypothetical protein